LAKGCATLTVTAPAPIPLQVQTLGGGGGGAANLQFTWTNSVFSLAWTTKVLGPYVKIPAAAGGCTNDTTNAPS
jgi:hypothetical protein